MQAYISDRELKIAEVQAYREYWKNKLRSAKTPEQAAEYNQKRNRCTEMLKNLRLQKQVAGTLVTDETKIKQLLKSEQNIQRGNDIRVGKRLPYARCKNRQNTVKINRNYPFQIQIFD